MDALAAPEIEAATLSAWPALQLAHDGLWLWRGARGYTKRANSIHCLDPSDDADADLRLAAMAALSRRNQIPPVFRVTPLTGPGVVSALDRAGWQTFEPSLVLAMAMPDGPFAVRAETMLLDPGHAAWYGAQSAMSGYDLRTTETLRAIIAAMACPARGVLAVNPDGRPAAAALAAVANGIGVYLNVVVDPAQRGKGYGRAVMAAALNWTMSVGARLAAIQVLASNAVAIGLYHSFGFVDVYRYHYRQPA